MVFQKLFTFFKECCSMEGEYLYSDHRHLRKDILNNGLYCLLCLSFQYCQWPLQKKENALEDVVLVAGTQQNLSNLYFQISMVQIVINWRYDTEDTDTQDNGNRQFGLHRQSCHNTGPGGLYYKHIVIIQSHQL